MKKAVLLTMIIGLILVYGKMSLFAQDIPEKANVTKSIYSSIEKIKNNERFKPFKPNSLQGDHSFTRNISGWSEPMLISTNPGGNQFPEAVLDNDGNIWVSWVNNQIGNGIQEPVYVSSYDGTVWAEPTLIDSVGFYESNTSMTVDNSGNVWIVWSTYNPSGSSPGGDVGAKYFDGTNWSSEMFVPMPSYGLVNAVPNLAVDGTGNTWVTWQHRNDRNQNGQFDPEDDFDIYSNYYDGVNWFDPIQVSTDSLDDWWNSSTADNEGNIWAGWCSNRRGEYTVYSSCNNGTGWSPDVAVVPELGDSAYAAEWIDMATDLSGNVWMAYQGYRYLPDYGEYIPATVVTYNDGNNWTPPQYIFPWWDQLYGGFTPNIGIDKTSGNVWIIWTGYDYVNGYIDVFMRNYNGIEWSDIIQVTEGDAMDYFPRIVIDNSGRVWVIWISSADGENNIYAKYNDDWVNIEENNPSFSLEDIENHPNPFNKSTTISFSVEGSDKNTNITIYNFNGQKIKTLVDKRLSAGTHQIVWDGTDYSGNAVSSGIYFYKMECGNKYIGLKKMILMK